MWRKGAVKGWFDEKMGETPEGILLLFRGHWSDGVFWVRWGGRKRGGLIG